MKVVGDLLLDHAVWKRPVHQPGAYWYHAAGFNARLFTSATSGSNFNLAETKVVNAKLHQRIIGHSIALVPAIQINCCEYS